MAEQTSKKADLRRAIRKSLSRLTNETKKTESDLLRSKINPASGSTVAIFAGTATEPQLLDLIDDHPTVNWCLPRITGPGEMDFHLVSSPGDLTPGSFGILEPKTDKPTGEISTFYCPGLAFTPEGLRLGQGGGYYDRALIKHPGVQKVGICFSCQILATIPHEAHDITMDRVLSHPAESI